MSPRLPILAFLWLAATSSLLPEAMAGPPHAPNLEGANAAAPKPAAQAQEDLTQKGGQAVLQRAIATMEARPSLFAKSSHHINLFGKPQVLGTALYLEQQTEKGRLARMDLKTTLGTQQVSTLVEVFDGDALWTCEQLNGKKLTKVDVKAADEMLKAKGKLPKEGGIRSLPGLWGLSKLLRGLEADFVFTVVQQPASTPPDAPGQKKLPLWILSGTWSPQKLAKIFPDQAEALKDGKPANLDKLPEHLPDHVILCLGKDDLFPYQIDYRRKVPKRFWNRDEPQSRSILTVKFTEVDFSRRFDASRFEYPGRQALDGVKSVDGTEAFVKKLKLDGR